MYSQTKQDIKNLRYILVVTYVGSNHAKFQRFWFIDKWAESFEIRPPTVHSNFTISIVAVETVGTYYTQDLPKLEMYICHLSVFPMHIQRNGRFNCVFQRFEFNSIQFFIHSKHQITGTWGTLQLYTNCTDLQAKVTKKEK